jgi:hypothetical protein
MNDPIAEIPSAINACAAASTADSQIAAFHKYCLPTTSFLHPMCYVASGSNSLEKVIEIYQFYRSVIPATSFEVLSVAFDEQKGQLFVKLVQRPKLRFTPGWLRVELPMLICFTVVKREEDGDGEGRWFIGAIEDFVQPMVSLLTDLVFTTLG